MVGCLCVWLFPLLDGLVGCLSVFGCVFVCVLAHVIDCLLFVRAFACLLVCVIV